MSENRQFLKGLEDKPHHITIPLEEWRNLTIRKCRALVHRYGVSASEVIRQIQSGDRENRTFPIKHICPLFMSEEECCQFNELRRIVKERNLDFYYVYHTHRKLVNGLARAHSTTLSAVPPALRLDIGGALAQVLATRATLCFGLHLIVSVQNEDAEQQSTPSALTDVTVRAHLERLPLAVLHRLISELCKVRAAWEHDLLAPSAAAAVQEKALMDRKASNALLYHVCLWQRRYPLELVSAVLSFYSDNAQLLSPATPASLSTSAQLESLLEEVHCLHYPDLGDVPGLIRCDVFMTYPHMSLEEQRRLMRKIAAAVAYRKPTGSPQRQSDSKEVEEGCVTNNLLRHSRTPLDPRLLLRPFVADAAAAIPERFCNVMSTETYHVMRAAFELHKHDGVRRLATQDYGRASAYLTPLPPYQSAPSSLPP